MTARRRLDLDPDDLAVEHAGALEWNPTRRTSRAEDREGSEGGDLAAPGQVLSGRASGPRSPRRPPRICWRALAEKGATLATALEDVPPVSSAGCPRPERSTTSRGFLLSRVDGMSTFEQILDVSGMPAEGATRAVLEDLWRQGVIGFAERRRSRAQSMRICIKSDEPSASKAPPATTRLHGVQRPTARWIAPASTSPAPTATAPPGVHRTRSSAKRRTRLARGGLEGRGAGEGGKNDLAKCCASRSPRGTTPPGGRSRTNQSPSVPGTLEVPLKRRPGAPPMSVRPPGHAGRASRRKAWRSRTSCREPPSRRNRVVGSTGMATHSSERLHFAGKACVVEETEGLRTGRLRRARPSSGERRGGLFLLDLGRKRRLRRGVRSVLELIDQARAAAWSGSRSSTRRSVSTARSRCPCAA